jgi:hypothetical protein
MGIDLESKGLIERKFERLPRRFFHGFAVAAPRQEPERNYRPFRHAHTYLQHAMSYAYKKRNSMEEICFKYVFMAVVAKGW